MIQARKANGDILVGSFEVSNADAQTLTCKSPADAVSHTDSNLKSNIQVTWTAPDVLTGNVMFRATVVKSKKTFWTNVVSTALIYNNKVSNTTTTALNGHTVTALNGHTATTSHGSSNSGFRLSVSGFIAVYIPMVTHSGTWWGNLLKSHFPPAICMQDLKMCYAQNLKKKLQCNLCNFFFCLQLLIDLLHRPDIVREACVELTIVVES
ncbi:hypothetical protein XENTR_v10012249 [Xenopus tropicalis]|nr:hypothetical protein XENTR_v10012249 [Xenopus tropicalis]